MVTLATDGTRRFATVAWQAICDKMLVVKIFFFSSFRRVNFQFSKSLGRRKSTNSQPVDARLFSPNREFSTKMDTAAVGK